ncbi:hypothetical protein [Endozoicomonas elysicola]|uniref:YobI-like P-loop NTPase domain-containing protein n=1 Tax=Endozoicomonas elysicola TaxID=305900 RepID=A0A081K6J1_9GAMM|nr:hypothetical protein [Endozoicomonas elysicola]KEI69767.1 hypothetical protein GV64_02540 [Endozoicomonas elysicola]
MALIQQTGLFRLKTKYSNAAKASWKAAREEFAQAFAEQSGVAATRIALKRARDELAQYLHSHDGHSTLKPLTPAVLRSVQIAKYERELLGALDTGKQPETRNIAISGTHAAGKSSFIHSFIERNPQYKYANISLAKFAGNNTQHEKMADVEQDIVQQLLYSITGKKLTADTAEQAQSSGWRKYSGVLAAFLTSSSIATLSYVSGNLGIDQSTTVKALRLYLPDHLTASIKKYAPLLAEFSLFFITTILVLFLFKGLQKLSGGWASRASRQKISEDSSISNSYLSQITHAFAQTRQNVVIIEDLMNANQLQAFEALYRINKHLNNTRQIKQPIYFIYALEDETLTVRDRTRFFDLIIPIVPVINTTNAGPKLYEQLETIKADGQKVTDFLDKELIYKVADYIDDMRVITNIVNEFDIYLNKITNNIEELNKNKLFAMMVIKNLYPKEHAELTHHNGILWNVFNEFDRKKRDTIEEYSHKIDQYREEADSYERSYIKNIKELRSIYWLKLFETTKSDSSLVSTQITGKMTICDFVEDHFWEPAYQSHDKIHIEKATRHGQKSISTGLTLHEITNGTAPTYEDRVKLVRKDIELTKAYIELLERTKNKLLGSRLSESLAEGTIGDSFINALTEEQFGPVLYLLRKGYFAEDYKDYLSYFYPGSISRHDKRLSLSLGEGQSFEFSQSVDSPKALLNHLTPSDLSEGRGFINAVISQLLESPEANYNGYSAQSFLYELFDLTENRFERLQDFICQYIHSEYNNHRKLFTAMFTIDQALIIRCITGDSSEKMPKAELVAELLPILMTKDHSDLNTTIIPVINALDDIRPIFNLTNEQPEVRQWLKSNPVKFDRLSLKHCSQEIALRVIEDSMYQLNSHMMGVLLAFTAEERATTPAQVSYSAICSSENPVLISQIHDQLEVFVKTILLSQPQLEEEQPYLIDLLNNPKLEIADRISLISLSGQAVIGIKDITDTAMQVRLFKENRVEASWSNVQSAFEMRGKNTIDPLLVKFISTPRNTEQLSQQALPYSHHLDGLLTALVCNEEISETTLKKLLSAFPAILIEQLEPENISLARMNIIRQLPNCQFSLETLNWFARFEGRFTDDAYQYLLRFWNEYKHKAKGTNHLTVSTVRKLLAGSDISLEEKFWLCDLLNHENETDSEILSEMLAIITSQPYEDFNLKISFKRLEVLIGTEPTERGRVRLVTQQIKYLSWSEISTLLSELGIEAFDKLTAKSYQFSVPNTETNLELVNALRSANYLGTIKTSEKSQTIKAYVKRSAMQSV